jgi:hypothetical protein
MERRLLKKLVLSVSITVAILAIAVYLLNENEALSESDMEYFPIADPCDLNCKKILEEQKHTCIELEANSYACRTEILPRPEGSIYSYVTPPELGEYFLFPPSSDQQLGSITKITLLPDHSVQIGFDEKYGTDSIVIKKGQKFTSYCFESKNVHVWTYTGMVEVSGKQYIEMHMRLAKIPEHFDCSNPIHILRKS